MRISIVGTGYVGLVSGVGLAEKGHTVTCVDVDRGKVEMINSGRAPIFERGLDELLQRNVGQRLSATTDLHSAIHDTEASLIAVGTPFKGNEIDLSYIKTTADQIGQVLTGKDDYHTVIVKSTVVPGTTMGVVLPTLNQASGKQAGSDFGVGMNPEFLREGEAVGDFMFPDRIILGALDDRSHDVMQRIYDCFPDVPKVRTSPQTAEMIKYTSNCLLATLISFSNEIANVCSATGDVDITEVMAGLHLDKRLSPIGESGQRIKPGILTYLEAGCGFGGSCFPKDVKAFISYAAGRGGNTRLLDSVIAVNERQPYELLRLLSKHFPDPAGKTIAVLGVAFKPGTDDVRESPAIPVIRKLLEAGATVEAFDPVARHAAQEMLGTHSNLGFPGTLEEAIGSADAIIIVTRWQEFGELPELLREKGRSPVVIDGRRMLPKTQFAHYEGIGL